MVGAGLGAVYAATGAPPPCGISVILSTLTPTVAQSSVEASLIRTPKVAVAMLGAGVGVGAAVPASELESGPQATSSENSAAAVIPAAIRAIFPLVIIRSFSASPTQTRANRKSCGRCRGGGLSFRRPWSGAEAPRGLKPAPRFALTG